MFSRQRGHTFVAPLDGFQIDINANTFDFNLLAVLGGALGTPITLTIRVGSGVIVASRSTATPAMNLENALFAGSTIRILNFGYILGFGGGGGNGGSHMVVGGDIKDSAGPTRGHDGGPAIRGPGPTVTTEITNGAGRIWGGGGGGGGGAATTGPVPGNNFGLGGGGGGGAGGGVGGFGIEEHSIWPGVFSTNGQSGGTGPDGDFGAGGDGNAVGVSAQGGDGGDGGTWGADGDDGQDTVLEIGGFGGAGGLAVDLNGGSVTFLNGSGSPNVKGAVS